MERCDFYFMLKSKYPDISVFSELEKTFRKVSEYFFSHDRILISVSGGSDSDCVVHLVCTYFPEYLEKCRFVFVNTGLEYDATKRHLCDLEKRYGIEIDRIRGQSVVMVVRKYGFPILSKFKATQLNRWQNGSEYSKNIIFYDGVKSFNAMKFNTRQQELAVYLKENNIAVSAACCDYSKKKPIHTYIHTYCIDLNVTGERQAEGGQRAIAHKSCFEEKSNGVDKYMPLWWWSNETKQIFKETEGIRYSDCYEVYGMRRTGCCGCPFNLNIADELQTMFEYEPRLFKACMNVFGQAYELTDRFNCRRKKCLPEYFNLPLFNS